MPLPDPTARHQMLSRALGSGRSDSREVSVEDLVRATEGYSGADVSHVLALAVRCCIREAVEQRDPDQLIRWELEERWPLPRAIIITRLHTASRRENALGRNLLVIQAMYPHRLGGRHLAEALAGSRASVSREEVARFESIREALQQGRSLEELAAR